MEQKAAEKGLDGGGSRLTRGTEKLWEKRRNIREAPFVYTGADRYTAALGEIQKKSPRWQPRGHDTQSFRPLVQEEEVSSGRDYSSAVRVSTPSSQWQHAVRLTRS